MGIREEKKERTRRNLLRAARELFEARGYNGATTAEIAARCGLAEGTLFNYYRSKADLFAAAVFPAEAHETRGAELPTGVEPRLPAVAAAVSGWIAGKLAVAAATPKPMLRELMAVLYAGAAGERIAARDRLLAMDRALAEELRAFLEALLGSAAASVAAECVYHCILSGLFLYALDDELPFEGLTERLHDQVAFILTGHLPA